MGLNEELQGLARRQEQATTVRKGWEPGCEFDEQGGEGRTTPRPAEAGQRPPSHEEVLREFGLDPEAWEVVSLRKSRWQAQRGQRAMDLEAKRLGFDTVEEAEAKLQQTLSTFWMEAFRATFRAVTPDNPKVVQADINELMEEVRSWAIPAPRESVAGSGPRATFLVALSDWQLGKGEGGGTPATTARILRSIERAADRLHALRRLGYQIDDVAFVCLGDMVEQCSPESHYAMQTFQADLNMRDQRKLAWQLALRAVAEFAPLADLVRISGIAGNHGESRYKGSAYTTFDDNDDLLMLDALHDIVAANPSLHNVSVELPSDPLAHTIDLSGTKVGFVHGHQFRSGKGAGEKAHQWWLGQMLGLQSIKDANILLNGHFHHLNIVEYAQAGRTTIQAPAMDGGSMWFTASSGQSAPAGMLTMLVGSELGPRMWDELRVL